MRRFLTGFVVAAVTAVVPVLALAGNQEVAEQIARNLRNSGQMSDYKIGVKFQDGTVWLRGHVTSQEQMKTALTLVFQTPGVTRVVNDLSAAPAQPASSQVASKEADGDNKTASTSSRDNPLRGQAAAPVAEKAQQSQQLGLVKRMEAIISRGSEQPASQPLPIGESKLARADRVPNTFAGSAVEPVSAEESREAPQPIETPQRAKPMSRAARGTTQVAMQQQGRGPAAPDGGPLPMYTAAARSGVAPARYDQPCLPNYAWPSYAAYPNYAGVTYPKQYSPTAWPYIGPFYPYPQVPLGWRKVTLEWDSGWWFLDFKDQPASCWHR
jgi:hypothetical protein